MFKGFPLIPILGTKIHSIISWFKKFGLRRLSEFSLYLNNFKFRLNKVEVSWIDIIKRVLTYTVVDGTESVG
jgi:hypothetical protein